VRFFLTSVEREAGPTHQSQDETDWEQQCHQRHILARRCNEDRLRGFFDCSPDRRADCSGEEGQDGQIDRRELGGQGFLCDTFVGLKRSTQSSQFNRPLYGPCGLMRHCPTPYTPLLAAYLCR